MRKALAVGINNYPTAPLRGCINDATAFARLIETNADHSPNFDVQLLTDISTKASLMGLIRKLFSGDSDTALFYFSGHGLLNELGGYIVVPDAKRNDEGISMDDLLKLVNGSACRNRIVILDCCNSGSMGSSNLINATTANISEGVTILTASRNNESAVEVNGHGIFTNLLLDALSGGAADIMGSVTPGSIYAYIDQALGEWGQRPVFKTNITRFTSLRKITPQVPQDILRKIITYFPVATHEFPLDPEYEYTYEGAKEEKVQVFKHLQKFESVGLVVPSGAQHMYWAAMNSKACKLTSLGYHYWRLAKEKRF
jgi:hypothetical protein